MEYMKWSVRNAWEDYLEGDCQLKVVEMDRLRKHKYSAVDTSWLDELCMQKFWDYLVHFYPMWLAPNLITLVGFVTNLLTVLILACYSNDAKTPAPSWAYFEAALGLFLYQTLDATDGKQARRTGSSSPLGELFDHGCDAISQVFVTLNICYAMLIGEDRYMVLVVVVLSVSLFYCAHWSTYCTGRLKFAKYDVTEAQMTVIGILLATGLFGTGFWTEKDTSVLSPMIPLLMMVTPFCMIYSKSVTAVYDDHITLFALCFGAVSAKATVRLVVAHMSRSELAMWDWIYLSPLMLMLNQYYDVFLNEYRLLVCATVYAYASLLLYSTMICRQLCAHLRIYCFSLQPRNRSPEKPAE